MNKQVPFGVVHFVTYNQFWHIVLIPKLVHIIEFRHLEIIMPELEISGYLKL